MNNGPLMNGPGHGPGPINGPGPVSGPRAPPSPPNSLGRSSNGTSQYPPPPGPDRGRKYNAQALEQQLQEHHRLLRDYLQASAREDHTYQPHNRARDKLLRLSPIQFQELSTDVYDELLRREDERAARGPHGHGQSVPRFLLPRNNFHPKRNQARQKLSTLPARKFRELATDVLFELERRFPRFSVGGAFGMRSSSRPGSRAGSRPGTSHGMGPPSMSHMANGMRRPSNASSVGPYSPGIIDNGRQPKPGSLQSSTLVPTKSTMVEDDDDYSMDEDELYGVDGRTNRSSRRGTQASIPYSVVGSLVSKYGHHQPNMSIQRDNNRDSEYQAQIAALEQKVDDLERRLQEKDEVSMTVKHIVVFSDEPKAVEEEREKSTVLTTDLENQLRSTDTMNVNLQREVETLKSSRDNDDWKARYQGLEKEFLDQHEATEEVRQQTAQTVQDIRKFAQQMNEQSQEEEQMVRRIADLESSVEHWKGRHAKTKAHLRDLRATSMCDFIDHPNAAELAHQGGFLDSRGIIRDTSVTRFQQSVEEVLRLTRKGEPREVLEFMRNVVSCVRGVTSDLDQASTRDPEEIKQRTKMKKFIAATTNNLVTTAKNHALAEGIAPVSLMEAAAFHVTKSVVDLIRAVRVRPSPSEELEDNDEFA